MKQRILVLNGQRIVQMESGERGVWHNEKVERAGSLQPGLYSLDSAVSASARQSDTLSGPIVHTDGRHVYQQIGKSLVRHDTAHFDKLPVAGRIVSIQYDAAGKATSAAAVASLARGRTR
jgi:cell filamentation protein